MLFLLDVKISFVLLNLVFHANYLFKIVRDFDILVGVLLTTWLVDEKISAFIITTKLLLNPIEGNALNTTIIKIISIS